ncbi:MAG: NfrA family protein [Bryobacteraceae bacterium]
MISARKVVLGCVLITAINMVLRAADQGFTDMEAYLPSEKQGQSGYSPAADAERFRSYARLDKAYRLIQARQLDLAKQELLPLVEQSPENWRACSIYLSVLYRLGEYAQLIRQADVMLQHQPHFIPALLYRSKAYIREQQLNEAIAGFEILERQAQLRPADRLSVLQTLADLYIRSKDYQRALGISARVLQAQPGYKAWFGKGLALDGLGHAEDAEQAYRSSLKLTTIPAERLQALKAIAESLRRRKSWSGAREPLLQALEIDPTHAIALRLLAETEYQLQNYEQAEGHARRLLTLEPNGKNREFLANIFLICKDWQKAQAEFRVLTTDENDSARRARAYRALSHISEATGNPSEGAEYLKQALAIEPSFSGREKLANLFIAQGNIIQADSAWTELLKEVRGADEKHRILLTLGQLKMSQKQYSNAAEVFIEAVQMRSDAVTLAAASNAEEQAGNFAAAIKFSLRAASQAPSVEAHLRLGTLQEKFGDPAQALASFETAAEESTTADQKLAIYKQIGFLEVQTKSYDAARSAFEKAEALDASDGNVQRSMAEVFMRLGRFADAAEHFKQALAIDHNPVDRRSLAVAQERAGDFDSAKATYLEILRSLAKSTATRAEVCSSLAELETKSGSYARAADWWLEASQSGGNGQPLLLASAAQSLVLAHEWRRAADLYDRYLMIPNLSAQDRARALESLAFISSKLDKDEAAAGFFQRAIDTGGASMSAHENLGFALYRLDRWHPALDAFLGAPASEASPVRLIAIAHCYQKLGRPGLAIHFLDQALQKQQTLSAAERRQAYADLGFLYADGHDYRAAIQAWQQAQHLTSTPAVALGLARVERLAGEPAAALKQLSTIRHDGLAPAERAQYFDELAQVYTHLGRAEDSRRAWEMANQIESTDARNYEIGLAYLRADQVTKAIPFLEHAAKPSGNRVYLQSLAYAYKGAGRPTDAVLCFEDLAASMPGSVETYRELAYLEMHFAHNASAERWFRKAIDAERPQADQQNTAAVQGTEGLREDLARVTNHFNLTVYEGYSDQQSLATTLVPALGVDSIVPAGAGIELDYQPPGIGFRNERIVQVFTRAMWSNRSGSLAPQSGSEQMGLGVRYKPLVSQNLQLSFERLFPLGSGLQQNWMARAMSSWSAGFDLRPTRKRWNYTLLFVDAAFLLQGPRTAAEFGQFRQGITFRVGDALLVTPYAISAARHQSPQAAVGTYIEAGAGLSLRFLFHEAGDLPRKSSFEALVDCHRGALIAQPDRTSYQGCRAAGILRF